jgi:glutaredoxin
VDSKLNISLITRNACHLCDEASDALAQVLARFASEYPSAEYVVENIDIDSHPELLERYSDEVPVVLLNGQQQSFWRIDQERLYAALEQTQDPHK